MIKVTLQLGYQLSDKEKMLPYIFNFWISMFGILSNR